MDEKRFDRSIRFFGSEGQKAIEETTVLFAGVGGLGSAAVQQGALMRIGRMFIADPGVFKASGRNRYVTAEHGDAQSGKRKVDIASRMVNRIDPTIEITSISDSVISETGLAAIKEADVVVGSLDNEGGRLLLLQACASLATPYFDFATEILPGERLRYGGRVCCSFVGGGCLSCLDILDREEANMDLASDRELANRTSVYGVEPELLGDSGPSVGPLNGVIANAGMFELMAYLSGLRAPIIHQNFNGATGKLTVRQHKPKPDCYFCDGLFTRSQGFDCGKLLSCERNRATAVKN
ncbi:MAG: HesA/MoeB/ThiF family protein [Aureliella sp.]